MSQPLNSKPETCNCEENQREERQNITIKIIDSNSLEVFLDFKGGSRSSQNVLKGSSCSQTQKSFDELLKLGTGTHEICRCITEGRKNTVKKIKKKK